METSLSILKQQLDKAKLIHDVVITGKGKIDYEAKAKSLIPLVDSVLRDIYYRGGLQARLKELNDSTDMLRKLNEFMVGYARFKKLASAMQAKSTYSQKVSVNDLDRYVTALDDAYDHYKSTTTRSASRFTQALNKLKESYVINRIDKDLGSADASEWKQSIESIKSKVDKLSQKSGQYLKDYVSKSDFEPFKNIVQRLITSSTGDSDSFDPKNATSEDYLLVADNSPAVEKAGAKLSTDVISFVKDILGGATLGPILVAALAPHIEASAKETEDILRSIPNVQDTLNKRNKLTELRTAILGIASNLSIFTSNESAGSIVQAYNVAYQNVIKESVQFKPVKINWGAAAAASGSSASQPSASHGSDGKPTAKKLANFLYRVPDVDGMAGYVASLDAFLQSVTKQPLETTSKNLSANVISRISALSKENPPDSNNPRGRSAAMLIMTSLKDYFAMCKAAIRTFGVFHKNYAVRDHRAELAYLKYWAQDANVSVGRNVLTEGDARKKFDDSISTYKNKCEEIVANSNKKLTAVVQDSMSVVEAAQTIFMEFRNHDDNAIVLDMMDEAEAFSQYTYQNVDRLFNPNSKLPIDAFLGTTTLMMYALKALRIVTAWASLRVASKFFGHLYNKRVYNELKDPPNIALLVLIFVGIDAALQIVIVGVLYALKYMFKGVDNTFPIDNYLLKQWVVDYGIVTFITMVIALIIGAIVQSKKYFRFKYEGDRGIRAFESMILYVLCIVNIVPFYRVL